MIGKGLYRAKVARIGAGMAGQERKELSMSKFETAAEAGRALIAEHLIQGGPGDADMLELAATLCAVGPAMIAALAACDEHCQAGLNSASPEHWQAALQDILDIIRPIAARIEGKA